MIASLVVAHEHEAEGLDAVVGPIVTTDSHDVLIGVEDERVLPLTKLFPLVVQSEFSAFVPQPNRSDDRLIARVGNFGEDLAVALLQIERIGNCRCREVAVDFRLTKGCRESIGERESDALQMPARLAFHNQMRQLEWLPCLEHGEVFLPRPDEINPAFVGLLAEHGRVT